MRTFNTIKSIKHKLEVILMFDVSHVLSGYRGSVFKEIYYSKSKNILKLWKTNNTTKYYLNIVV